MEGHQKAYQEWAEGEMNTKDSKPMVPAELFWLVTSTALDLLTWSNGTRGQACVPPPQPITAVKQSKTLPKKKGVQKIQNENT